MADDDREAAALVRLLEEMIAQQEAKLLAFGRRLVPHLTPEDMLQPHDHRPLAESPAYNYEDGYLAALRAVLIAVRARIAGAGMDSRSRNRP
jgi:hypothetical protein